MSAKHTSGPWIVGSNGGYNACTIYTEGERHNQESICSVYGIPLNTMVSEVTSRWDEGMANARLIAAAPDLLEALEMVRDADDDCIADGLPRWCNVAARAKIDAAIAKATGADTA